MDEPCNYHIMRVIGFKLSLLQALKVLSYSTLVDVYARLPVDYEVDTIGVEIYSTCCIIQHTRRKYQINRYLSKETFMHISHLGW